MLGFVVRRVLSVIPTLLGATFIVFVLLDLAPGNPARRIAGEGATPDEVDRISQALGLDDPLLVRYWRFLGDAVHGDLGTSLFSSRTVWDAFSSRMPITLGIILPALALSILVAVPPAPSPPSTATASPTACSPPERPSPWPCPPSCSASSWW